MKKLLIAISAATVISFAALGINQVSTSHQQLKLQEVQLKSKETKLNELKVKYDKLNERLLDDRKKSDAEIKKLRDERDQLDQQRQELEKQVSAKREAQRLAQEKVNNAAQVASTASAASGGSCESWIASAGIADVVNARELIRRESGCNPRAVNQSSGACGVAQELPCGKSGCSLGDGACQVRWMNKYVHDRYGSWAGAVAFHNANNWY